MDSNQLLEIIYFLEDSYIGEYVRGSLWLFPVIQSFHLIGLGILGGAVVIGDFRLLGILMKTETTSYVIRVTKPWFNFGLSILSANDVYSFNITRSLRPADATDLYGYGGIPTLEPEESF